MVEIESFRDFKDFEPVVPVIEALFVDALNAPVVAVAETKPKPAPLVKKEN